VLCFPTNSGSALDPRTEFGTALLKVRDAGGSGLVFAQYTTDILHDTASCEGMGLACVLVDLDTGYQIFEYGTATGYNTSGSAQIKTIIRCW
jgi:hypothetical protein